MPAYFYGGLVAVIALGIALLRHAKLGDFVKVEIPRTADKPLAMGTRLDVGAALKKAGVPKDELRRLLDGDHDQELLDRYWALNPP